MESLESKDCLTKKQLATLYGLSPRSFRTLFKRHEALVGEKNGRYFSKRQVEQIFELLGTPSCLLKDEFIPEEKT